MNVEWNAHVKLDNAAEAAGRFVVATGWGVIDDNPGKRVDYRAAITLAAPEAANPELVAKAPTETVDPQGRGDLSCGPDAIEIEVTYLVSPATPEAKGSLIVFAIAENAARRQNKPEGAILAHGTGRIGDPITVKVAVPGFCP